MELNEFRKSGQRNTDNPDGKRISNVTMVNMHILGENVGYESKAAIGKVNTGSLRLTPVHSQTRRQRRN